jgi:23S rRNA-/tRNA-specific pseudouridylate synthase
MVRCLCLDLGHPSNADPACKDARTRWQLLASDGPYSVLKLHPETGRKHQLRVHCAKVLDGPIVGDFKYGYLGPQIAGHLLHCHSISFYVSRTFIAVRAGSC